MRVPHLRAVVGFLTEVSDGQDLVVDLSSGTGDVRTSDFVLTGKGKKLFSRRWWSACPLWRVPASSSKGEWQLDLSLSLITDWHVEMTRRDVLRA